MAFIYRTPLIALILLFPAALAGQIAFTGAQVLATPGAPSETLYAYRNGLFKSADLGRTWTSLYLTEAGLLQPRAIAMVIDSTDQTNLYMASTAASGMVWKSSDAGAGWTLASAGLPTTGVDPIYFAWNATNRSLYLAVGGKLYKSADGAATWTVQGTLPGAGRAFDICGAQPNRMYYGENESVYSSVDEGRTWRLVTALYPPPTTLVARTTIGVVAVDYTNPENVVVSMGGGDTQRLGIYRSTASGANFEKVSSSYIVKLTAGAQGGYYGRSGNGGTLRSNNLGLTWTPLPQGYGVDIVDPRNGNIVYVGSGSGLARSTDSGASWSPLIGTVTPTLSKEAAPLTLSVEQGALSAVELVVTALEFSQWSFPFTASTSGEPWLSLDTTTGTTPRTLSVRVVTTALAIGTYSANITLSATATANKSVTIPVRLTVTARDAGRPDYTISIIAGRGDGVVLPKHVVADGGGSLYIAESWRRVWRQPLSLSSPPLRWAGNGEYGSAGDGGSAVAAELRVIDGMALGPDNALYISDQIQRTVRRIAAGTITLLTDRTTPVTGVPFVSGPKGLAVDSSGRLLVTAGSLILRLAPDGKAYESIPVNISPALTGSEGIAVDAAGNIYVSSSTQHRVYRISVQGTTTVVAGTGTAGFEGDGGLATAAKLRGPSGLAVDREGNLYICDEDNHRVRLVTRDGVIRTIAGTGAGTNSGDGGPAYSAGLNTPTSVILDTEGNVYVATLGLVRKLARTAGVRPALAGAANAASGSAKVSPGGIVSIYGQNLAAETLVTSSTTWPNTLGGAAVTINGRPAPLWFVSAGQINAQVPLETPIGTAQVAVSVSGATTATMPVQVVPAAPGLLACPSCGPSHALAANPDGQLNSPQNPARVGDTIVVYLAGVGPVAGTVRTGEASPSAPLPVATLPQTITLGGRPAAIVYLGLTPTFVALAQANVTLPALAAGTYPLVITVNGEASNALNISVRP